MAYSILQVDVNILMSLNDSNTICMSKEESCLV